MKTLGSRDSASAAHFGGSSSSMCAFPHVTTLGQAGSRNSGLRNHLGHLNSELANVPSDSSFPMSGAVHS